MKSFKIILKLFISPCPIKVVVLLESDGHEHLELHNV